MMNNQYKGLKLKRKQLDSKENLYSMRCYMHIFLSCPIIIWKPQLFPRNS